MKINEEQFKKIELLVEECIDYIFVQAHSICETKSGDITPEQMFELREIEKKLLILLLDQLEQNL